MHEAGLSSGAAGGERRFLWGWVEIRVNFRARANPLLGARDAVTDGNGIRKVAILGGGCGAMAAALELTSAPDWRSSLDVTVYQMGWRLGGKGAAGRNAERGYRIEEHGLHIWLGFYNNAFRMIRQVYAEADRPLGAGLQNWRDAFTRHDYVVLEDHAGREWSHWGLHMPENDRVPGDDDVPTAIEFFVLALRTGLEALSGRQFRAHTEEPRPLELLPNWLRKALDCLHTGTIDALASEAIVGVLRSALRIAERLDTHPLSGKRRHMKELVWLLSQVKRMIRVLLEPRLEQDVAARRLWELFDIASSALTGMVADGVLLHGYEVIDDVDFTEWLVRNGLTEKTRRSAALRVCYDLTFGFVNGQTHHRSFAAGSGLYGLLNMMLAYHGSVMWKMTGGMGDTIFAPIYEVLARRGVQFRFFHKVVDILADAQGSGREPVVEELVIEEQVRLERPYEPLTTVRNTASWPNEPRWEFLVDGDRRRREGVDFESWWDRTPPYRTHRLRRGRDFDLVVLGTSLAPLRFIARDLQRRSAPFRAMVENVKTVETQAVQLWTRPSLYELGWKAASPIVGAYWEPLDTVADLTELLVAEDWGTIGQQPRGLVYLCGPLACSDDIPLDDPDYPKKKLARVKENARAFLRQHAHHLWPDGSSRHDPHGIALEHLVGPPLADDEARFEYQFFRANVDPDQRYVLTLPGTNRYRLRSDRSGFANLVLAGDWTQTPFNAGCVEAAVISGLMASRAICGRPVRILADKLFLES
jgi:uncharacterized protein with NAD-binding domain and iron-sulfur cluster